MKEIIIPAAMLKNPTGANATIDGKIRAAIHAAEGRATVRTITEEDIINSLKKIENTLAIPKKSMENLAVTCDPNAQSFPNAYKFTPMSTCFDARFSGGKWRITKIYRAKCDKTEFFIRHTVASRAALVENFTRF